MPSNSDEMKQSASGDSNGGGGKQKVSSSAAAAAPAPHRQQTTTGSRYEDRMRAKLRKADENQAAHRARAGMPSGGVASVASSSVASKASAAGSGGGGAATRASGDAAESNTRRMTPSTSSRRADRFWNKANESEGSARAGAGAAAASASSSSSSSSPRNLENTPQDDFFHEPSPHGDLSDSLREPPGGESSLRGRETTTISPPPSRDEGERERDEVHAEYGFRGDGAAGARDEVRGEVGFRPGEVEGVASGIIAPLTPAASIRDRNAKEGDCVPGGVAIVVSSANNNSLTNPPPVVAGGDLTLPPSSPGMGRRKDSMDSIQSVGGVPGAHSIAATGHTSFGQIGHGSSLGESSGFLNNDENPQQIFYDQNNTPMVVARAVTADDSDRNLGGGHQQDDSFNDNGDATCGGLVVGPDVEQGGSGRRASTRVLAVAVATHDTFKDHLFRSRKTQCGLVALVVVVAGLVVGLGVALGGGGGGDSGSTNNAAVEDLPEDFWQQSPATVDGTEDRGDFGATVSMNLDGTRMVAGAPGVWEAGDGEHTSDLLRRGLVAVHQLDSSSGAWVPLGEPILPSARDSKSDLLNPSMMGVRALLKVVISGDGHTVAVGSPFHDLLLDDGSVEENAGQVEVYRLNDSTNSWIPMGEPIVGDRANDYLGASVDLSEDGGTLAVGIPGHSDDTNNSVDNAGAARMFFFNNNKWEMLGSADAVGTAANEMLGGSVSLASDGRTVAVGSSATQDGSNTKIAKVFKFFGGDWREIGNGIEGGENLYDTAYTALLSADGTRVVVSNHYIGEDGPAMKSDQANDDLFVAAFEYKHQNGGDDDDDAWEMLGTNLHASSVGDKSGYFVTLSGDGNVIGMGDPGRSVNDGRIAGHAHIYVYDPEGGDDGEGEYTQVGPNIDGEAAGDMFGYEVALSGDGMRYAIGAPSSRGSGFEHGRVQIYDVPQSNK